MNLDKYTKLIFIIFISLAGSLFAETDENGLIRGKIMDQYATITGGWYLEKKCNVLSVDEMREFKWHIFHIGQTMQKTTSRTMLILMQKSAQDAANSEKYGNCNDESKRIINSTVGMSRRLNKILNSKEYTKAESDKEFDFKRYDAAAVVTTINNTCPDYVDDQSKLEIKEKFGSVNDKLMALYGMSFANYAVNISNKINKITIKCNDKTKRIYFNSLGQLSSLASDLGL